MDTQTQLKEMATWWASPLGAQLFQRERERLQTMSRYFHGHYQLQIGAPATLLPTMSLPKYRKRMAQGADVVGHDDALPFKASSFDTILLSHVLEMSATPHQLLREADRVLVGDGTLVICCFNPWSSWGARRLLSRQKTAPWHGHFFGKLRLKDWLVLLNFDVIACQRIMLQPPINHQGWLSRLAWLDHCPQRLSNAIGAVTILVAAKRTIPLTPIAKRWRTPIFSGKRLLPQAKVSKREKSNGAR
ncbi:MAG TPA: methylase [Gammaproteobacteria bacterium]|nr:methylase [Gammaproteobacteria bacterium]